MSSYYQKLYGEGKIKDPDLQSGVMVRVRKRPDCLRDGPIIEAYGNRFNVRRHQGCVRWRARFARRGAARALQRCAPDSKGFLRVEGLKT